MLKVVIILRFMEFLKNDKIRKKNGNKDSLVILNF